MGIRYAKRSDAEVFNGAWRTRCSVKQCSVSDVGDFMKRHYLGRRPGVVTLCLVMECDLVPVGCIVFALPPRETSIRMGGVTWELARLFIDDSIPANAESWLIAKAVKLIRSAHHEVVAIISYADPSAGHHGGVYVASGFERDGRTDEGRKTPRFDYRCALTGKHYSRRSHVPDGVEIVRVPRVSKFRYVKRLKQREERNGN